MCSEIKWNASGCEKLKVACKPSFYRVFLAAGWNEIRTKLIKVVTTRLSCSWQTFHGKWFLIASLLPLINSDNLITKRALYSGKRKLINIWLTLTSVFSFISFSAARWCGWTASFDCRNFKVHLKVLRERIMINSYWTQILVADSADKKRWEWR